MKRARKSPRPSASGRGQIRIIAGQWRGRKLPVTDAIGLRPTTDRNKETLFNWLMQTVNGARCLDMFAGSGGLGIEALSRYASSCVFIEQDKQAARQLSANLNLLQAPATVLCADALSAVARLNEQFDLVFVDPPFGHNLVNPAINALLEHQRVQSGSLVYVEQEPDAPALKFPASWQILKQKTTSGLSYMLIEVGD